MIYFLQGSQSGNIKIGYTKCSMEGRLKLIQANSSDVLVCLKTVTGSEKDETLLHKKYEHLWSHAEWFKPSRNLLKYIESLPVTKNDGLIIQISRPWSRCNRLGRPQESRRIVSAAFLKNYSAWNRKK